MNLVKEKQGGLVPTGLKRWPIKLIEHFADATGVSCFEDLGRMAIYFQGAGEHW